MAKLPDYVGPAALGIKMGVILPGTDLIKEVCIALERCSRDNIIDDGDVLCITESVVARAQNNYVSIDYIAEQVRQALNITADASIGVLFPILSRNRFSMVLKGIARAVPQGRVVIQLSYPNDEVGNQLLAFEDINLLGLEDKDILWPENLNGADLKHPITGVDYVSLYRSIVESEGAEAEIFLSNRPQKIAEFGLNGLIIANIHDREKTKVLLSPQVSALVTLQQICSDPACAAWSEWGLLGSNMSYGEQLKLAPCNADKIACEIQLQVKEQFGKKVEVVIYGDGAYRDPTSGIYELADPRPAFGTTKGLNIFREGFKYKYLADKYFAEGKSTAEIETELAGKHRESYSQDAVETEGTTPRRLEDILASLADLVSGSADAGTPLVIIKGFLTGK